MMEKLAREAAPRLGDGDRSYLELIDRVMKPARAESTSSDAAEPSRLILP
jgi:hypothetical protein